MSHLYSHEYAEVFGCNHRWSIRYDDKSYCHHCGMLNRSGAKVYKSLKMKFPTFFNPGHMLQKVFEPTKPLNQLLSNTQYLQIRPTIIEFMHQVGEQLHVSLNTTFLATLYLDTYMSKCMVPDEDIYMFASTAMMLAAKAQELDERIPFISKLKKYSSMTANPHPEILNIKTQEFRRTEAKFIQALDWKLQHLTLIDRVEYLLSLGVLDDDDTLSPKSVSNHHTPLKESNSLSGSQVKSIVPLSPEHKHYNQRLKDLPLDQVYSLTKNIETTYKDVCLKLLKDKILLEQDPVILALSCVAFLRKEQGLLNIWSQQLQSITQYSVQHVSATVSQIISIFTKNAITTKVALKPIIQSPLNMHSVLNGGALSLKNSQSSSVLSQKLDANFTNRKLTYLNHNVNENNSLATFVRDLERSKTFKVHQHKY